MVIQKSKCAALTSITLRQWAILFSILFSIIMAVVTTCMVLGYLHSDELRRILEIDIQKEHERHSMVRHYKNSDVDDHPLSSNEIRLHTSQETVLTFQRIVLLWTWLSGANLFLSFLLIYGVVSKTPIYVLAWTILCAISYIFVLFTIIMAYFGLFPGLRVTTCIFWVVLSPTLLLVQMWYTIFLYYQSLDHKLPSCYILNFTSLDYKKCASLKPYVVHAYGGYTHTIQPMLQHPEKATPTSCDI